MYRHVSKSAKEKSSLNKPGAVQLCMYPTVQPLMMRQVFYKQRIIAHSLDSHLQLAHSCTLEEIQQSIVSEGVKQGEEKSAML